MAATDFACVTDARWFVDRLIPQSAKTWMVRYNAALGASERPLSGSSRGVRSNSFESSVTLMLQNSVLFGSLRQFIHAGAITNYIQENPRTELTMANP